MTDEDAYDGAGEWIRMANAHLEGQDAVKLWSLYAKFSHLRHGARRRTTVHVRLMVIADEQQAAIQRANLWLCERYHGIVWDGDITATEIPDGVAAI